MSKYFSLIYSGEIHTESNQKVISSDEFSKLMEAADVLQQAKSDVKEYLENNKEECSKLLKQAEEAGYNDGLSKFNEQIMLYQEAS